VPGPLLLVGSFKESLRALTFDAAADTEDESIVRLLDISRKRRLGPRASRIKLAAAARDAEDGNGEGEIAAGNLKRAQEVAARQQRLDRIDADLAELEAAVDEGLQIGHDPKEEFVRRLVGRLHEVDGLLLAINELQEANPKLRGACVRTTDGGAAARGQAVVGRCWEEVYDVDKQEIRRSRDQRNRTRADALSEQAAGVAQKEEEADCALKTILAIEGDARYLRRNSPGTA
jgi:hypothetical protein